MIRLNQIVEDSAMSKPKLSHLQTVKISFLTHESNRDKLDELAVCLNRDRSYVLNEAISAYLETQAWMLQDIQDALNEAEAGDFVSEDELTAAFSKYLPQQ
jgi:predicted transcriptional regulator